MPILRVGELSVLSRRLYNSEQACFEHIAASSLHACCCYRVVALELLFSSWRRLICPPPKTDAGVGKIRAAGVLLPSELVRPALLLLLLLTVCLLHAYCVLTACSPRAYCVLACLLACLLACVLPLSRTQATRPTHLPITKPFNTKHTPHPQNPPRTHPHTKFTHPNAGMW